MRCDAAFSTEADDLDMKLSGTAFQLSIGIGGAVSENLVLGGQLWMTTASEPVGKEWFLGENFGLGFQPTFASSFYGLALSATFQ